MKIRVTEQQLKLIIESEKPGKLLNVNQTILNEIGLSEINNILKSNKKYIGINFSGDLSFWKIKYPILKEDAVFFCDNLVYVSGTLDITSIEVYNFPNLLIVDSIDASNKGEDLIFPKLTKIKTYGSFRNSYNVILPNLEEGGDLNFLNSKIESLPSLIKAENLVLRNCYFIKSLPNLVEIKNNSNYNDETILRGDLNISNSNIESLPKLEYVEGDFNMSNNYVIKSLYQLPNLKYIGNNFDLENSLLTNRVTIDEIKSKIEVGFNILN